MKPSLAWHLLRLLTTSLLLAASASPCGDPITEAAATSNGQLVVQSPEGAIRIGEQVFANLVLPEGSDLTTGTLSRAGCTSFQFKVEPHTGWHDPWADWYYSGILDHANGVDGPRTCGVMGYLPGHRPPPQINFTLNDWIQFDRPGTYKISLTYTTYHISPSVANQDPYDYQHSGSWVRVETQPVEVLVAPESRDVTERAATALTYLRSRFPDDLPRWGSSDSATFPNWAVYSQSEAVVPILTQFYEQGRPQFGLINSPHQQLVVDGMEKELADPRHSVSWDFLQNLAFLATRLKQPGLFGRNGENRWTSEWEADSRSRSEAYLSSLAEYTQKLLDAIPQKHQQPQSDSLSAVLIILSRNQLPGRDALRKRAAEEAAELWPRMTEPPYITEYQWKIVASSALLPLLRDMSSPNEQRMRWIYQVAPKEARRSMIKAVAGGHWQWAAGWAEAMPSPAGPSAALDQLLAKGLRQRLEDEEESGNRDSVVLKFGGPKIAPEVRSILTAQHCLGSPALWRFLLKHEGKAAEGRLLDRYRHLEPDVRCETDLSFQQVVAQDLAAGWRGYWSPEVEQVVVAELRKKQPQGDKIEIGAANLLERFGSPSSKAGLWEALARFQKSHAVRQLAASGEPSRLEESLISAIVNGYHWYPDPADVQRLKTLCVEQCDYLKWIRHVDDTQMLYLDGDLRRPGRQYGVKSASLSDDLQNVVEWMQRYPAGTRFSIMLLPGMSRPSPAQAEFLYPELAKLLRDGHMELVGPDWFDEFGRCARRESMSPY